ncbi:MAG TPA: phosphotransferase [Lapillicoccus sp.]|nr:phosphotransferase [Lapillicoccus sp.]
MTSLSAPTVDYAETSRRPAWSQLPDAVRAAVGRLGGGAVQTAQPPVRSGFTGSYAGIVTTATGRRLFAKAGAPEQPHVVAALAQEAFVLEALPAGVPAPPLVGFESVDGWSVLVLGVVAGRMPGRPWSPDEVEAVHRACVTMADLGTPWRATDPDLGHALSVDPEILAVGQGLVDGSFDVAADQPGWLAEHRERVGELVLGAEGRFDGETLCHGDLRPDNLLVTDGPGVATVVDWNWVGAAAPWVDWVGLLPLMAAQGVDTDALLASSPLTRDADPEAVDAFLATIGAYMLGGYRNEPPPGCTPALRRHQLLMAHVFLGFLRRRRGWPA